MMLGDLGAEVIHIERPGVGDQTRAWGPPFQAGESAYYLSANRNKRGITLNFKHADGQAIFRKLVAESDIVVENFRSGTLEKLGIGWSDLRRKELIWCSITGYGREGVWAGRGAYDLAMQAEGGMMSITGTPEGTPVRVGVAIMDLLTAHQSTQAILAALYHRERSGDGQLLDMTMLDCAVGLQSYMAQTFFATGDQPIRLGSGHPNLAPYQAYTASDGWIIVAAASQALWERLCEALELPELIEDERFLKNENRVMNRDALEAIFNERLSTRTVAEWEEHLQAARIPATPVHDLAEVFALPPIAERGNVIDVNHPEIPDLKTVASPMRLTATPPSVRRHPPKLGEHTGEVLGELGYSSAELARFSDEGVI
jgi:crotonobetainyl-CoA:carnitine CoA-transferase CaiB-like acyl-CoA transferase